jgi:hypothetical protein
MKHLPKLLCCLLFIFLYAHGVKAQAGYQLKGKIALTTNTPADGISLYLQRATDSVLVKVEVTNATGQYVFDNIKAGQYRLKVADMMVSPYRSAVINLTENTELPLIMLTPKSNQLKEVNVRSSRPFIQQQYDKTVINVDGSITAAGSTAMEILQRAPGVTVDQAENIRMRGRSGVLVMIDGKQVPMSGTELSTYLKGLPANALDRIDLVTNPSAKYDAAGTAGIIDIRLKRNRVAGTNGNVTASYGQGKLWKGNTGFNLNYKNNRFNLFSSYNYTRRSEQVDLDLNRRFYNPDGSLQGGFDQDNHNKNFVNAHLGRIGADYTPSGKTTVGVALSFYGSDIHTPGSTYSLAKTNANLPDSYTTTLSDLRRTRTNPSVNLNFKQAIDSTGKELSADLDYARYNSGELQNYNTSYFTLQNNSYRNPYLLFGNFDGVLTVRTAKADYVQPFKQLKARLEAGWKSSWVKADNELAFYDQSNNGNVLDASKSNHFVYDENINAGYLNLSRNGEVWNWQLGLRLEHTDNKGIQLNDNTTFKNDYAQLFPSGYLGYKLKANHEFGLSLSRRIDRPTYRQLNPFRYYINENTYQSGNPYLQPQLTYAAEVMYNWQQKYMVKYSYNRTSSYILSILIPDLGDVKLVQETIRNLARLDYHSINLSIPFEAGQWLSSTNNILAYYGKYKGNLANTNIRNGRVAYNINSSNTVKMTKGWLAEVVGSYQSSEIIGLEDVRARYFVTAGISKQLWGNKANIKLNISDIFYTNQTRATDYATGYFERYHLQLDTRVATMTFTYKFGNSKNAPKRKTGGAEDERRRAG